MPRLSLYTHTQGNNYKFFDRAAKEMYQVGGTDLYIHKYIGTNNPVNSTDATQPHYDITKPTNIQDLLFLENRDRKYDQNIFRLRGHYNVQNLDFDLSQFGLFLTSDVIFVTVHYNQMLEIIGRKLMVGDVFELPHLEDFHPLDETIPVGLRRYYQVTDANWASESFSATWYAHSWRIKCEPLTNSQEFQDIMADPINKDNYMGEWNATTTYQPGYTMKYGDKIYTPIKEVPPGITPPNLEYWTVSDEPTLVDIVTTYNKNLEINQAIIDEAKRMLPLSGYDTSGLYIVPSFINNIPAPPIDLMIPLNDQVISRGVVEIVRNPGFRYASAVIRLLPGKIGNSVIPNPFSIISLQAGEIRPPQTATGSGQVFPDPAISISIMNNGEIVGPYGTADNTYSTSDQYVATIATATDTPAQSLVIEIQNEFLNNITIGLVIKSTVYSENGTPTEIFPLGTTILSIDPVRRLMSVSNRTAGSMIAGTPMIVSYNFNSVVTDQMDFRADCDPAFQFIKRSSPRNFGYLNGYLTGDGTAPNGEPFTSGTQFPTNAQISDYFLRIDYMPQQLFRFDGFVWVMISNNVRTDTGFTMEDKSLLSGFINDLEQTPTSSGKTIPTRQSLSQVLRIKPD